MGYHWLAITLNCAVRSLILFRSYGPKSFEFVWSHLNFASLFLVTTKHMKWIPMGDQATKVITKLTSS